MKMTKSNKKNIVIAILSVSLFIVSYIAFKSPSVVYDKDLIEKRIKELNDEKNALLKNIEKAEIENNSFKIKIDSLKKTRTTIIKKYEGKYKAIDNANNDELLIELQIVFATNDTK